jgi:hypothetical protein
MGYGSPRRLRQALVCAVIAFGALVPTARAGDPLEVPVPAAEPSGVAATVDVSADAVAVADPVTTIASEASQQASAAIDRLAPARSSLARPRAGVVARVVVPHHVSVPTTGNALGRTIDGALHTARWLPPGDVEAQARRALPAEDAGMVRQAVARAHAPSAARHSPAAKRSPAARTKTKAAVLVTAGRSAARAFRAQLPVLASAAPSSKAEPRFSGSGNRTLPLPTPPGRPTSDSLGAGGSAGSAGSLVPLVAIALSLLVLALPRLGGRLVPVCPGPRGHLCLLALERPD